MSTLILPSSHEQPIYILLKRYIVGTQNKFAKRHVSERLLLTIF